MEVKIGMQFVARELVIETNSEQDEVAAALADAVAKSGVFTLMDHKGGRVMIPANKIAYVEFGGNEPRRVGFGNASGPSL